MLAAGVIAQSWRDSNRWQRAILGRIDSHHQAGTLPLSAAAGPIPPGPAEPTLVGRERELAVLRDALAAALSGRGTLVLIGGEAGIGKTTLAEVLCREATEQGALVLVGRCYDLDETPPYGPWRGVFAKIAREAALPVLPAAVLAADQAGEELTSQSAIFARLRDALAALAARQPLVILLDDLHWSDPASLDLLRFLGRDLADLPLLLLVTYRVDELTRRDPLYALLPILVREARAGRVDLHRLVADELRPLIQERYRLPDADEARLVGYLGERAEGNPFYLGELLRTLESARILQQQDDHWVLGSLVAVGVPPLLRQVIDARVDRLGETVRGLLAIAATIGQTVALDVWADVAEVVEDALLDPIERSLEAGLLLVADDGAGVRFAHALLREALYEGALPLRRRAWHRRTAEFLADAPTPDPDTVAHHFRQAGDPRAVEWLVRAGERARRAYAWLTAAERYEMALALQEQRGSDARQRALWLMILAQLRRYANPQLGIGYLEEAERLAVEAQEPGLAAAAAFDRGHLRWLGLGEDPARGLAEMHTALPTLEALPDAVLRQLPALVVLNIAPGEPYHRGVFVRFLAASGHLAEAQALGAPLVAPGAVPTGRGLTGLGLLHSLLGQPAEARRSFAAGAAVFRAAGQHFEAAGARAQELRWVVLCYQADDLSERRRLADEVEDGYRRAGGVNALLSGVSGLATPLFIEGTWERVRQAQALGEGTALLLGGIGVAISRARGDREHAWVQLRRTLPAGSATAPGTGLFHHQFEHLLLAALLALADGDLPVARTWLEAHDRWLAWSGALLYRSEGQRGWAEYHRAAGDLTQALHHAERALAYATEPRLPLDLLAAHRLLGELRTAAGEYAMASEHLDTAIALAVACAAPYERALTLLAQAELHIAAGDREGAQPPLTEARKILIDLGAKPALTWADALAARLVEPASIAPSNPPPSGYPAGLSAREAEVLRLVARGLTNAQVAERLYLSPRTIDQHLRSIYNKLGVDNRTAAAHLAVEYGLV